MLVLMAGYWRASHGLSLSPVSLCTFALPLAFQHILVSPPVSSKTPIRPSRRLRIPLRILVSGTHKLSVPVSLTVVQISNSLSLTFSHVSFSLGEFTIAVARDQFSLSL